MTQPISLYTKTQIKQYRIGVWNVPRCSEEDGDDEYDDTPLDNDGVEYDLY